MTWLLGLPSGSSHALFGGLIGAVIVGAGIASVNGWVIVSKVLLPAIVAPLVAGIALPGRRGWLSHHHEDACPVTSLYPFWVITVILIDVAAM